jgi:biopolymer transport protein ExbB
MIRTITLLSVLVVMAIGNVALATPDQLDELVRSVREEALQEAAHDQERIDKFLDEQAAQQKTLDDAKANLVAENRRADNLREQYENNEDSLTEYEIELQERAGDLNDLFAIVRQTALNASGVMDTSLVAAENADRSPFLEELGKGEQPPNIDDIKQLWTSILTEIAESGKVVRFNATVIKPQGNEASQTVTRAGVFTSVSNGAFLRYLPDSGKLVELSRQPAARFQRMARNL